MSEIEKHELVQKAYNKNIRGIAEILFYILLVCLVITYL